MAGITIPERYVKHVVKMPKEDIGDLVIGLIASDSGEGHECSSPMADSLLEMIVERREKARASGKLGGAGLGNQNARKKK